MKMQSLRQSIRLDLATMPELHPLVGRGPLWARRLAFAGPVAAITLAGTALAALVTAGVDDILRWPLLALVAVNLFYVALVGWPGILGYLVRISGHGMQARGAPTGLSRTALLMPIHKEDPQAVFAAIEVMACAIAEALLPHTDLFVLSDTQDAAWATAEAAAYTAMVARLPPGGPTVTYRRRTSNAGRKVGNLGEFCATHGAHYDYMMVLDADSLMGASAIANMIGLMDANPRAGIIQSVPFPVGRDTLFARVQQFSARLYTPLLIEGLTFWQQGDGNYWGHNAIVRIAPFMQHCTMPVLPGREPWGGEILCHDVVEAGLMRGAGYDVWVLPEVMESWEALPANMVDYASRERRWCQGNLQHTGLLGHAGLRPVGRFHLAYGVMHYASAPLVLALLALATADAALGGAFVPALLGGTGLAHTALAVLLVGALYGGKLLSLLHVMSDSEQARTYGGRVRLLAGAVGEQLGALVVTAVLIVLYTGYILDLVRGRTVRWETQPRDNRGLSWREGWLRFRGATALGVIGTLAMAWAGMPLLLWSAPILAGLLAAVPAVVLTSRLDAGRAALSIGLFVTPEERAPPATLRALQRALGVAPTAAPAALQGSMLAATAD